VIALWALIIAVRAMRAPEAAFLTAAGAFHALARAGLVGSAASLGGTLVLLLLFGPVASLGGIVMGEAAMSLCIMALMRRWRRAHG
jgi:O-antigen/teichoic acid export membrane protein